MPRDKNPNRVKRSEVDEVFIATAGEVMYRKHKKRTAAHEPEAFRKKKLEIAEEIVLKAKKKKEED